MALVKLGSIVTDIKGKIGGSYFSGSLGGTALQSTGATGRRAVNQNPNPYFNNTQSGQRVSSVLLSVVRSWKNVSPANKSAWVAAAPNFPTVNKFGVPVKPSGYHTFVHINYSRLAAGNSLLSTPPVPDAGTLPVAFTITTCSSAAVIINLTTAIPSGYLGIIKATRSMSAGIKPSKSLFTSIYWATAGASGSQNISSAYVSRYGGAVTGNTLWVELILSSLTTGVLAQPYIVGSVVS